MSLNDRITIIIGMIIGERIVMIRVEMRIDNMIIEGMIPIIGIKISHHLEIMVVNNIKGVVIRTSRIINYPKKYLISQKHLGNFSMILREKTLISTKLDVHNMIRVWFSNSKLLHLQERWSLCKPMSD